MPLVKYAPFTDSEDFPTGVRIFQDTINRLLSDQTATRPLGSIRGYLQDRERVSIEGRRFRSGSEGHRHPNREQHSYTKGRA